MKRSNLYRDFHKRVFWSFFFLVKRGFCVCLKATWKVPRTGWEKVTKQDKDKALLWTSLYPSTNKIVRPKQTHNIHIVLLYSVMLQKDYVD